MCMFPLFSARRPEATGRCRVVCQALLGGRMSQAIVNYDMAVR